MSELKEKIVEALENNRETDAPSLSKNAEIGEAPFLSSPDFDKVFEKLGLTDDKAESKEPNESKDYSDYLEKGDDGKYYDKQSGKSYDSVEAWEKAQTTLAKRYESTAKHYEEKAKKEWARFKNAEDNGESDEQKWSHYYKSQECYTTANYCKEKAEIIWEKLGKTSDVPPESK